MTVRHPSDDGSQVDLDEVARRFELQRTEHHTTEQGFLLWALFDVIVDRYFEVTDAVDDRLDEIEQVVFSDKPPAGGPARDLHRAHATSRPCGAPRRRCARS